MQQHEEAATTGGLTGWPLSEFRKRKLEIQFTGSGSEYFRIVNLLLTIVTASLYWPFAKARRIRYFYANTLIDGHALSFHGDPWKMFRGHLLLLVLMGTYSAAGHFSPNSGRRICSLTGSSRRMTSCTRSVANTGTSRPATSSTRPP